LPLALIHFVAGDLTQMPNQYTPIPDHTRETLIAYVIDRHPPGSFLRAVMENNLTEAVCQADELNLPAIHPIVVWAYNFVPALARGNPAKVRSWLDNEDKLLGQITRDDIKEGIQRFADAGPGPNYSTPAWMS